MIEWAGLVFAVTTVVTIAAGHHLVRKVNYYWGTWPAYPLFILGTMIFVAAVLVESNLHSGVLGIIGMTTVVDGVEVLKQEKRIAKGFAPMNPNRPVAPK